MFHSFAFYVAFLPDVSVLVKFEVCAGLCTLVQSGSVGSSVLGIFGSAESVIEQSHLESASVWAWS